MNEQRLPQHLYRNLELDIIDNFEEFFEEQKIEEHKVPQIFIPNGYIGGYKEFMKYIDQINAYETQIYYASQNTKKWSPMKQNMTSPKYTTNWYELPKVNQIKSNAKSFKISISITDKAFLLVLLRYIFGAKPHS